MPDILIVDTKSIESPKGRKLLTEIDYETLDESLNLIQDEQRILINPEIKSRTYKDGTVTHPKGEGLNKNYPTFREEYERIKSLLEDCHSLVFIRSREVIDAIDDATKRYRFRRILFEFSAPEFVIPWSQVGFKSCDLIKIYRKICDKNHKEQIPSNIKMLEEILVQVNKQYGLTPLNTSVFAYVDFDLEGEFDDGNDGIA